MMFIILCYDVGVKRVARVRKTVKKYLSPMQESVFEGEITPGRLAKLKKDLTGLIEPSHDSIILHRLRTPGEVTREQIGINIPVTDSFF